jgi:hypothetical protein
MPGSNLDYPEVLPGSFSSTGEHIEKDHEHFIPHGFEVSIN